MSFIFPKVAISLFLLLFTHTALGQSKEIVISAVKMRRDSKTNTIKLNGKVQAVFKGQHLSCDQAIIYSKEKKIDARGNVLLVGADLRIEGSRIEINYADQTGTIYDGFVQVGQVLFEGEVIRRTGPKSYETESGRYTACTTCPPAWTFSGSHVKAEIGQYAHITNSILSFGRVPVFWLPYLIVPLKSERQTGFLFPRFEFSGRGKFALSESFFWAISRSQDATITAKNYAARGPQLLTNYRYILNDKSRGEGDVGFIYKDKVFSGDDRMAKNGHDGSEVNRYFLTYKHQYHLPENYQQNLQLNIISDNQYLQDFPLQMSGYGEPALENRFSLSKNTENYHASLDSSIYYGLMNENPISDNKDSVHRFPELNYALSPTNLGDTPFIGSLGVNYSNFSRQSLTYDNRNVNGDITTPDGGYDASTDLIRTGQRLHVNSKVSAPFTLGPKVDIQPSVSYNEYHYQFAIGDSPSTQSRFVRTDLSARTQTHKVFGDTTDDKATRYKHVIQPEISYTTVPWVFRPDHPFFGGTGDEVPFFKRNQPVVTDDVLQFDYNDRLIDKNLVTYSLTNKLIRRRWNGETGDYKQIATFRLAQSYDFYEAEQDKDEPRQPWSEITGLLDVRLDYFETNTLITYYPYQNQTAFASRARLANRWGDYVQLIYTQDLTFQKATETTITRTENIIASAGVTSNYVTLSGSVLYSITSHEVRSWNYQLLLRPPGNCWGVELWHNQVSKAIPPDFGFSILFLFDGKTATSVGS